MGQTLAHPMSLFQKFFKTSLGQNMPNRLPRVFCYFALSISATLSLYVLAYGWHIPILDQHGFRQTQTAVTAYWLIRGGNWFVYETPVLGSPWSVPFEFPLYQWFVAVLGLMLPSALDQVGRGVSYFFHVLCLVPLCGLFRLYGLGRNAFFITAALFLSAPVYLFWGRAFLMESTALCFSLFFLATYSAWLSKAGWRLAMSASILATLGILTKVTTFLPVALLAGVMTLPSLAVHLRNSEWKKLALRSALAAMIVGIPVLMMMVWLKFSDYLKSLNFIGETLTSERLSSWNFGTLEQRISGKLWLDTIRARAIPEALGGTSVLWVSLGILLFLKRRAQIITTVLLGTYTISFLAFTNLHIIHNYYQYANAVFMVAAIGIILGELSLSKPVAAVLMTGCIMALQWHSYLAIYHPSLKADFAKNQTIQVAKFLREHTSPQSALVVLGYDWSSELSYYAERKSVSIPNWIGTDKIMAILDGQTAYTSPLPISAFVVCQAGMASMPESPEIAVHVLARFSRGKIREISDCQVALVDGSSQPDTARN